MTSESAEPMGVETTTEAQIFQALREAGPIYDCERIESSIRALLADRSRLQAQVTELEQGAQWAIEDRVQIIKLQAELEGVRKLISDHNAGCIASCEATKGPHHCDAYLSRGRAACPECPRDWMIETP